MGDTGICGTGQKPLVSVRQKCDGSQCLSVTRKQQHQLKQMVMYLGINGTAEYVGLSVQELAGLLVKKFPPRRKGISAAQLRNAKRVNRQIMGMAKQLQDACKTTTRRR
jgi:thiamine monophosphate synthase